MLEQSNSFSMLVQGFFAQALMYFVVVGLVYLAVWKWGESRFQHSRIQAKKRADGQQIKFEVKNTFIVLLVGAPVTWAVSALYASGMTKLSLDASAIGWPTIVATFFGLLVFNDLWFYCWHRTLHHPKLFRHVHSVHHKSVDTNPFSSYSFHWFEGLILGAWVLPASMLVPMYIPMLGLLTGIGLANNVMSHLGVKS